MDQRNQEAPNDLTALVTSCAGNHFFFQGNRVPWHNAGSRFVARATPRARSSFKRGQDGLLVPRDKGIPRVQKVFTEAPAICLNFCRRGSATLASLKDLGD